MKNMTPMESAMEQSLIQHMVKEENNTMLIEWGKDLQYVSDESLKNYKDYVYAKEVKRWYAEKIANQSTRHQQQ